MAIADAKNSYGVVSPSLVLDLTKTYHGLAIVAENGNPVGRIQSYTANFAARTVTPIYELNALTWGRVIDNVPGIETGRSISTERVEVWEEEMELAFGSAADKSTEEWVDLCDQTNPFTMQEAWFRGEEAYRRWEYSGCWFTSKSIGGIAAQGEGHVIAAAEMVYVYRRIAA